jgi:hypothetical protein
MAPPDHHRAGTNKAHVNQRELGDFFGPRDCVPKHIPEKDRYDDDDENCGNRNIENSTGESVNELIKSVEPLCGAFNGVDHETSHPIENVRILHMSRH